MTSDPIPICPPLGGCSPMRTVLSGRPVTAGPGPHIKRHLKRRRNHPGRESLRVRRAPRHRWAPGRTPIPICPPLGGCSPMRTVLSGRPVTAGPGRHIKRHLKRRRNHPGRESLRVRRAPRHRWAPGRTPIPICPPLGGCSPMRTVLSGRPVTAGPGRHIKRHLKRRRSHPAHHVARARHHSSAQMASCTMTFPGRATSLVLASALR